MVALRYAELVEPGKLVLKEEELTYNNDQILIRINHCGLCQYDGAFYKGFIGQPPVRLGHEPVGVVEAVGDNVRGIKPGDRVKVSEITYGHGTDAVFEVTGHPVAVELAAKTMRWGRARYALAG